MRRNKDGTFERTDIWREGKWIDLWSVVHFLSGVSVGIGLPVFHFGIVYPVLIALLSLIAYELWEAVVKIEETPQNRVMDVVVGMMSFLPFFFLTFEMSFVTRLSIFLPVLAVNVALATLGWNASQKAAVLEASLRYKFAKRRERLEQKRARRAAMRFRRQDKRQELNQLQGQQPPQATA